MNKIEEISQKLDELVARVEALEKTYIGDCKIAKNCIFQCKNKEEIKELSHQCEALNLIFGDAYVAKLREIEDALVLLNDYLFGGDKTYVKLKQNPTVFED